MRSRFMKALGLLCTLTLGSLTGCGDDEDDDAPPPDSEVAAEAARQVVQYAPTSLPEGVPEELLQVTIGGTQYDLVELLGRSTGSAPYARIVAAYRTVTTPEAPPPLGTSSKSVSPDYTRSAPAAQVYECRQVGGVFTWALLQPEAGLEPITTQPVSGLELLVLDHFRYPGDIDYGPPTGTPAAGPSWRISAPVLDSGTPTSGQTLFIGAVEAMVLNGTANVPLLRVANVARVDQDFPVDVFSRTSSDTNQLGFVLRLSTEGGIAPTSGCGGTADLGQRYRSPYSADYYFLNVYTTL
jgi:Protein of unknown function (DUF3455)